MLSVLKKSTKKRLQQHGQRPGKIPNHLLPQAFLNVQSICRSLKKTKEGEDGAFSEPSEDLGGEESKHTW